MPDPSDLAATLRRLMANPKQLKAGTIPVEVLTHDFLAEVADALDRGAAAERALAAQEAWDNASGFEDEHVLVSLRNRKVDAWAAYDALTETRTTDA